MTQTYCGLLLRPITPDITPNHNTAFWNNNSRQASSIQFSVDTHYIDLSNHPIRVKVTSQLLDMCDNTHHEIVGFVDKHFDTILAFQSDEELSMALLKYPEVFTGSQILVSGSL